MEAESPFVTLCVLCTPQIPHIYNVILLWVESSWNVMAHGDAREGKWRGNWRMEWVASTLHTTSQHGVSSITTADEHTSAASSRKNWRPRRFKWTRPFRRKKKLGFCACVITFQTQSTNTFDWSKNIITSESRYMSWRFRGNRIQQNFIGQSGASECEVLQCFRVSLRPHLQGATDGLQSNR
jgi:hypothetical protein